MNAAKSFRLEVWIAVDEHGDHVVAIDEPALFEEAEASLVGHVRTHCLVVEVPSPRPEPHLVSLNTNRVVIVEKN